MLHFIKNSALGKRFYAELYCMFRNNGLRNNLDIFDDYLQVIFEEYFSLSNDLIMALCKIAYKFDLLIEFRADNNCVIVEFHKN